MVGSVFHESTLLEVLKGYQYPAMSFPIFQPQRTESDFNVPGMDELSASLGLPGAKKESTVAVSPARCFGNQKPRMVMVEDDEVPLAPEAMRHFVAPPPPTSPVHPRCHSIARGQSSSPFQQHARRPSGRRRPRHHARTKRTDQGPEPSAADIYPEDADWLPSRHHRRGYFAPRPHQPQPTLHVEDAVHWPTPAEVYKPAPPQPSSAHSKQDFNVFEPHIPPSPEDLDAADGEVLTLIKELPDASIPTLISFGAFDLLSEDRALTPMQESGRRYGMNFYGIGIGDAWDPPAADEEEPFRVRPRDHEGWGGWDWAIEKGWADE
ncbi:hypothetical protein EK21DRAFT_68940 [Setomelanomma holmii]|uniref:Uncharacterized protein n=1 Tax=Setomelanomma holmii TaxID=210430 RepID=A0A9P4LL26_9PLEO|nr:hypothetical protein EK21DRAFT_68940 [Setomelanomma holmii]